MTSASSSAVRSVRVVIRHVPTSSASWKRPSTVSVLPTSIASMASVRGAAPGRGNGSGADLDASAVGLDLERAVRKDAEGDAFPASPEPNRPSREGIEPSELAQLLLAQGRVGAQLD